jgi:Tol biopolymer transport system component/DNA-binding winged helix-turn-helix (wHTH) protein
MSDSNSLIKVCLYEFSVFSLDTKNGLFVDGKSVKLAPKVFQTLVFFVENRGRVISKDELFDNLWTDTFVEDGALSFNISQLRKSLFRYDNQTEFIETIPKRGFRFNSAVKEVNYENIETELVYEKYQTQELVYEEVSDISPTSDRLNHKRFIRVYIPVLVGLSFCLLGAFAFKQWQQKEEIRSLDSLHSVKLTSWNSIQNRPFSTYSVSHDGKMLAFSSNQHDSEGIYVKQINGGEDIRITKDKWNNFSPVWSPDDQQIAFASSRGDGIGIYVCPSLGGNIKLLRAVNSSKLSLQHWSNDGSAIFYESEGNLFRLNIAVNEVLQITVFPTSKTITRNFALSPDETKIAYCDKENGQTDVWVLIDLKDKPLKITDDADVETKVVWHPDSYRLLYNVLRDNHNQINAGFIDGRKPVNITRGDSEFELIDVSKDGKNIFYASWQDESDICSVNVREPDEAKFVAEPEMEFWSAISPDGKLVAYQANSFPNTISEISNSTIEVRNNADKLKLISTPGFNHKWLPNSTGISFLRWEKDNQRYNLWTINLNDSAERKITENGVNFSGMEFLPYNRNDINGFDWSKDGREVVYLDSKRKNVLLTSLSSGETTNISQNSDENLKFYCPIWSNDGKRIAFISRFEQTNVDDSWSVWLFEEGVSKKIYSTKNWLRLIGWAQTSETNGEILLETTEGTMKSGAIDVNLIKIAPSGETKIVNKLEQISALSMVLSADGRNVAYTKRHDNADNIYVASVNNEAERKITRNNDSDLLIGSLTWTPDSNNIFFDRQQSVNIISMLVNFK